MTADLELAVKKGRSWTISIRSKSYKIQVADPEWVKLNDVKFGYAPQTARLTKTESLIFQQTFEGDLDKDTLIRIIAAANAFFGEKDGTGLNVGSSLKDWFPPEAEV